MEHFDALRLHAAQKYLLGELSPQLRDEYEEHYFGCQECAGELKVTAAFMDGSRATLLAEQGAENPTVKPRGWFGWLQPRFAIPVFATLLLIVGYQNFVTIPHLKSMSAASVGVDADFVSLIGANSRSESTGPVPIHPSKPAILEVDIPGSNEFTGYTCRLQDGSGTTIYQTHISAEEARRSVHLIVPQGKLQAQKYSLVVFGEGASPSATSPETEIERLTFEVEILR
jgi:hypothetical protein